MGHPVCGPIPVVVLKSKSKDNGMTVHGELGEVPVRDSLRRFLQRRHTSTAPKISRRCCTGNTPAVCLICLFFDKFTNNFSNTIGPVLCRFLILLNNRSSQVSLSSEAMRPVPHSVEREPLGPPLLLSPLCTDLSVPELKGHLKISRATSLYGPPSVQQQAPAPLGPVPTTLLQTIAFIFSSPTT